MTHLCQESHGGHCRQGRSATVGFPCASPGLRRYDNNVYHTTGAVHCHQGQGGGERSSPVARVVLATIGRSSPRKIEVHVPLGAFSSICRPGGRARSA